MHNKFGSKVNSAISSLIVVSPEPLLSELFSATFH